MNLFLVYIDIITPSIFLGAALTYSFVRRMPLVKIDYILLSYLSVQVALNSTANLMMDHHVNNHWVYLLNSLLTQTIFTYYYYLFFPSGRYRKWVITGYVLFICFFVTNLQLIQPYDTFNSYSYALGALIIVLYGLFSFSVWMELVPTFNIVSLKKFWTSAGVLFYFGSSFFIFISYHYLSVVSPKDVGILWQIHNLFLGVGCFLFFKAVTSKKWILK